MRPHALAAALKLPNAELRSVPASGDCFYDAIHLALPPDGRPDDLADAEAMRDVVADNLSQETFDLMKMFAEAGVEGYEFMTHHRAPTDLGGLRAFARKRGKECGAGQCLWADEHALQTICALAGIRLLIYDEQAPSRGSRSGRTRGGDEGGGADNRFVCVGGEPGCTRVVLLHRSRRQHYSPIFVGGKGCLDVTELPVSTRALWGAALGSGAGSSSSASASSCGTGSGAGGDGAGGKRQRKG